MFSLNRVYIIGYQTQPVDVRQTPSGTSVTDLNLMSVEKVQKDSGETFDGRSYHTVTCWGPMAEVAAQYLKPGGQVFVSGRLQTDSWEDQESGEKRSKTKMVAMDLILLDPKDGQIDAPSGESNLTSMLNRADIIGNVTQDPEIRTTTNGTNVLTLGVATNDRWKDKASGEQKERSEFHNVVIWGDLATEVQQNIRKGRRVYVSGRVQTRAWETQSGSKRTTTEIVADRVTLLGTKNALVEGSVSMSSERSAPRPEERSAATDSPDQAPVAVPDIQYESEVKASDLPF